MTGESRREKILSFLKQSDKPVSGTFLSDMCNISRPIIVQDIALLRADGNDIISTNRGYILRMPEPCKRTFRVNHTDAEIEDELSTIVSSGGCVLDVIVRHDIYGELKASLNICTIDDVKNFVSRMNNGEAVPLKNVTDNIHYHTVTAPSDEILDTIACRLREKNFLQDNTY